ncbi:MAG: adenylyl-sulfate kinase [Micropruina sp.]|uniref:adenylyl-sulfate kinase n=1 Tax=Micropruina sp. TaxID=2737536 RepID=UPI0039E4A4BC
MTNDAQYDDAGWEKISELPSIVVEGVDLDLVDLRQRGLTGPRLQLTENGLAQLGGKPAFVVRDVEATPLLLGRMEGAMVSTRTLRVVEPARDAGEPADLAVVVKGIPSHADLARIEVLMHSDMRVSWLVLAGRTRAGRDLVAQIQAVAGAQPKAEHTVTRVPWPGEADGKFLRRGLLPEPAAVAQAFGALHHVTVGDGDGGGPSVQDRGGTVVFFTGLSGSGKSTLAKALRDAVEARSDRPVSLLDGDDVRRMLSAGLGFDEAGRAANVRRVSWVAALLAGNGGIAITALIAPFADVRAEARKMATDLNADFLEVWVSTPIEECERRDRKGLYALARAGQIPNFTGIDSPYQAPTHADLVIDTSTISMTDAVDLVFAELEARAVRRGTDALTRTAGGHLYQGPSYDI